MSKVVGMRQVGYAIFQDDEWLVWREGEGLVRLVCTVEGVTCTLAGEEAHSLLMAIDDCSNCDARSICQTYRGVMS